MKLPQYRLLKISAEDMTTLKAEWVEFVTCEGCKHFCNNECMRPIWHTDGTLEYPPRKVDDFCSYGEPKTEVDCFTCKHDNKGHIECQTCNDDYSSYEPEVDCRRCIHFTTDKCRECFGKELFIDSGYITKLNEPKTDCSWK